MRLSSPDIRPIIHATGGLTWSQIRIDIAGKRTIHLTAPGQEGRHVFRKCRRLGPEHPLGSLASGSAG
jgi:hypothetical protein